MRSNDKIFKIITLVLEIINICEILFLTISLILTAAKTIVLNKFYFISFIIVLIIDVLYLIYISIELIKNKNFKRR